MKACCYNPSCSACSAWVCFPSHHPPSYEALPRYCTTLLDFPGSRAVSLNKLLSELLSSRCHFIAKRTKTPGQPWQQATLQAYHIWPSPQKILTMLFGGQEGRFPFWAKGQLDSEEKGLFPELGPGFLRPSLVHLTLPNKAYSFLTLGPGL